MSTQLCKLVVLAVRAANCRHPRSIPCSGQVVLTTMGLSGAFNCGAPSSQSRAYSLDSLSSGPGRPSLVRSSTQQPRVEGIPASSALTQRNLSAVAVQVILECRRPHQMLCKKQTKKQLLDVLMFCLYRDSVVLCADMTSWILGM